MFAYWELVVDQLVFSVLGFAEDSHLANALHFFIYDTVKIYFLLLVIIYAVTFLRSYLNTDMVRNYLQGKSVLFGHVAAALFGIITPFCTCSAIPLFLGFLQARIPIGVTFSYLISAPMNNEIAIAMLLSLFGWEIALMYIGLGLLVAVIGGLVIGMLHLEKEVLIDIEPGDEEGEAFHTIKMPMGERIKESWAGTKEIFLKVWLYVAIGVGVGAFIHGFVPADLIADYAGGDSLLAVPLATLFGIPMYSNAAGVMPLIEVLTDKGMLMGTALSFMMAVTALSLPEAMILKSVLSKKLIAIFFGTVALGIMMNGYLFNIILH